MSASQRSSDPNAGDRLPDQGVRERPFCGAGCHAVPGDAEDRQQRLQRRCLARKNWEDPHCVAGSDVRWRETRLRAVRPLSTQIVGKTQAKENLLVEAVRQSCRANINACQEYEGLSGLATVQFAPEMLRATLANPPMNVNAL